MSSSPFNPRWPNIEGKADPEVVQSIRLLFNVAKDHDDAFSALNTKVGTAQTTAESASQAVEIISGGGGGSGVTSVALEVPSDESVQNSPLVGAGTLIVSRNPQNPNSVLAGPTSGAPAVPGYRTLVPADCPAMGASGAGHQAGIAPDPGAVAGITRFLCEDATYRIPTASSTTHSESLTDGNSNFIFAKGDIVTVVGVPN